MSVVDALVRRRIPLTRWERSVRLRILRAGVTITDPAAVGCLVAGNLMHARPDLYGVGIAGLVDDAIRWSA